MSYFRVTPPEIRDHKAWLGYVQPVGLVVSIPALEKAQCFVAKNVSEEQQALRAIAAPEDEPKLVVSLRALCSEVLGWTDADLVEADDRFAVALPEYGETLKPTHLVLDPDAPNGVVALVTEVPEGMDLDSPRKDVGWEASPEARLERLLRESSVPIGLLFNQHALRLVYAPRGESSGHATFRIADMTQVAGRPILGGMLALLSVQRMFNLGAAQRLPAILKESRQYQNEVSTKLSVQVLGALHDLLHGFQSAHEASEGRLLNADLREAPEDIYGGLLTTLLRLVFIMYAEDRSLLPRDEFYLRHYTLGALFEKLREDAAIYQDTMDQRYGAWSRLLTLFRVLHDGVSHGGARLPARFGRLFDPDAYPFLEGRERGSVRQLSEKLVPPRVSDGVVYRVLEKLLILDGDRLSYRALDVEQLGSVYEAMMGFSLEVVREASIGVRGKKKPGAPPADPVIGLETLLGKSGAQRVEHLKKTADVELTGKSATELKEAKTVEELVAALGKKASPFTPHVLPAGSMALQPTEERRRSGSHYTPRILTEPIVEKTLRPVLDGLGERPTAEQILGLKVCDPAMGSGAFLVAACRALGDELVRSWQLHGMPQIPPDEDPLLHARRLVAQRCLYGVDKNPFAVDLAKLSLWLVTLAKDHPFTFLDHALRCGDSLVGLSREQIASFHWAPEKQVPTLRKVIDQALTEAQRLRAELAALGDSDDTAKKRRLLDEADAATATVRRVGDLVLDAFFSAERDNDRKLRLAEHSALVSRSLDLLPSADEVQRLRPFHWEIEFPEVFYRPNAGFDGFVGNPPFAGGSRVSTDFGDAYISYLKEAWPGLVGKVDLVVFFFHRVASMLQPRGAAGLIATYRIADGANAVVGLRPLTLDPWMITWAVREREWPGAASTRVSQIVFSRRTFAATQTLDGQVVPQIGCDLRASVDLSTALELGDNSDISFLGAKPDSLGFLVSEEERVFLEESSPSESPALRRYIVGSDLTTRPSSDGSRWIIDFSSFSEAEAARRFPRSFAIVSDRVRPGRLGLKRAAYRERWWQFTEPQLRAHEAARQLPRVLGISRVTKYVVWQWIDPSQVISDKIAFVVSADDATFGLLQSALHDEWALRRGGKFGVGGSFSYSPTACFRSFAFPRLPESHKRELREIGARLSHTRTEHMVKGQIGLTGLYNRFHDPNNTSREVVELRRLHAELDAASASAYGWSDLDVAREWRLEFGSTEPEADTQDRREEWRLALKHAPRELMLGRLLALNAERAAEEKILGAEAGLKNGATAKGSKAKPKKNAKAGEPDLFGPGSRE